MGRLLYFYPENDIALAVGTAGFTAPRAAAALRAAGAALPLWYGDTADRVILPGVNARWYDTMSSRLGMSADVYAFDAEGLTPEPWGWSLPVRATYLDAGVPEGALPSVEAIGRIRELSHRRTSVRLAEALQGELPMPVAAPAHALTDAALLPSLLAEWGPCLVKQPWSSSGRGVIDTTNMSVDDAVRQAAGIIRRQQSAMVERRYERVADFALLFRMEKGVARYCGLSLFDVDHRYCYTGNIVAPQDVLVARLEPYLAPGTLCRLVEVLSQALAREVGVAYEGPLGVDMMVVHRDGTRALALAEMNLRNTMGHVCLALAGKYLAPGVVGRFYLGKTPVLSTTGFLDDATIIDGRLSSGTLPLTPEGDGMSFLLSVAASD